MKNLSLIIALIMLFIVKDAAFAQVGILQTSKTSLTASRSAQTEATKLENLKERANTEIARRIIFLTKLSTDIDAIKKLSDVNKASLKSQIQTQIDNLNALKIKINADTDLTILREDVKSIINGYSTFAYFRVKISLYVAAERLINTHSTLNVVYTKLNTRVSEKEASGEDVTTLRALLLSMNTNITNAKANYDSVLESLNTLDAASFSKNKAPFLDIRAKLKLGAADLRAAYKDAVKIRQGLGDISGNLKKGTFETKESTTSSKTN